jgi:ATP-dependent Clp protease ATP-binding subunit ClpA
LTGAGLTLAKVRKETSDFLTLGPKFKASVEHPPEHRWACDLYKSSSKNESVNESGWSGFDASAYAVFELAFAEARKRHDDHVGIEHLLLGLCSASNVIQRAGLDSAKVAQLIQHAVSSQVSWNGAG